MPPCGARSARCRQVIRLALVARRARGSFARQSKPAAEGRGRNQRSTGAVTIRSARQRNKPVALTCALVELPSTMQPDGTRSSDRDQGVAKGKARR